MYCKLAWLFASLHILNIHGNDLCEKCMEYITITKNKEYI